MGDKTFELIKELTEIQGTSGFEDDVRRVMKKKMSPYVDKIEYDGLGGIFGIKKSKQPGAPKVMVGTHG